MFARARLTNMVLSVEGRALLPLPKRRLNFWARYRRWPVLRWQSASLMVATGIAAYMEAAS